MGQSANHDFRKSKTGIGVLFRVVDFLNIGHVCHDITSKGIILGGSVSYAAAVAKKLGVHPGILTSCGDDFQFTDYFVDLDVPIWNLGSESTTTFKNVYNDDKRTQYMFSRASDIDHIPPPILEPPEIRIIQLGLIADEVRHNVLQSLPKNCLIGACIQGWLRATDDNCRVIYKSPNLKVFNHIDIVFMSDEDLGNDENLLNKIIERVPLTVVTKGYKGALVYHEDKKYEYGAFPGPEVDPTGAGDVFSTAFLISYSANKDIDEAVSFAHSAASLSIEDIGVEGIPNLDAVLKRQQIYKKEILMDKKVKEKF